MQVGTGQAAARRAVAGECIGGQGGVGWDGAGLISKIYDRGLANKESDWIGMCNNCTPASTSSRSGLRAQFGTTAWKVDGHQTPWQGGMQGCGRATLDVYVWTDPDCQPACSPASVHGGDPGGLGVVRTYGYASSGRCREQQASAPCASCKPKPQPP